MLEHGANPSLRVDYKGIRSLPEVNGNEGPWAKDEEVKEDVIDILHKARRQKSKNVGKLAKQAFYDSLKESLADNPNENAKSYLENIADMREKMRTVPSDESEIYFGWNRMYDLKTPAVKTQRERDAIEEEFQFHDKECDSCVRRECGKVKKRKLRKRTKRAIPALQDTDSDCLIVKQEVTEGSSQKKPLTILEELEKVVDDSDNPIDVDKLDTPATSDYGIKSAAESKEKDQQEDNQEIETEKNSDNSEPEPEKSESAHPSQADEMTEEETETATVAILPLESETKDDEAISEKVSIQPTTSTASPEKEHSTIVDSVAESIQKPAEKPVSSPAKTIIASVTVDLDDLPLTSAAHYEEKNTSKTSSSRGTSLNGSHQSVPDVIDLTNCSQSPEKPSAEPRSRKTSLEVLPQEKRYKSIIPSKVMTNLLI